MAQARSGPLSSAFEPSEWPLPPPAEAIASEIAQKVPMEYRAQAPGRCQRQYIKKPKDPSPGWKADIQHWIEEWVERIDPACPFRGEGLRLFEEQVDWRLISNSGIDEGTIRPVLGGRGWPVIPGSGIKGLFRRACNSQQAQRWCGSPCAAGDLRPGILRFHGAWPLDNTWTEGLLDVAHPQQNWQVGFKNGGEGHSAFGVVSLRRPKLCIALSSTDAEISQQEWQEIETTLRTALDRGLGGRTCVGYGTTGKISGEVIFQCRLEGQGPAARLLTGEPEFRPTMFRAAIRGMALRLFGGLTDATTAMKLVGRLFGSLSREEGQNVGLLATAYTDTWVDLGMSGKGSWAQPVYATSGTLQWRLMRRCRQGESEELVRELLEVLHGLTMNLGGFGKSWRRPDHRIFYPDYGKTPIGCHWQWLEPQTLPELLVVRSGHDLTALLRRARAVGRRWLSATGQSTGGSARWREVIHPDRMRIWIRQARDVGDAEAIHWFHRPPEGQQADPRDLKATLLGGKVNRVGHVWNRMLPLLDGSSPPTGSPPAPSGGSAVARPTARPTAMARPTARPGAAMARPGRASASPAPPQGDASITPWPGRYLESFVLFPPQGPPGQSAALEKLLDRGADADFQRVQFEKE